MTKGKWSMKRGIAVLLSACMVFGMTPITAGAENLPDDLSNTTVQSTSGNNVADISQVSLGNETGHYDDNGFCTV